MRRLPPGPTWTLTKLMLGLGPGYVPTVVQEALVRAALGHLGLLLLLDLGALRLDLTGTSEGSVDFTHVAKR